MPQMTRAEAMLKGLVRKAIKVKQDHTTLSISTAMRVAKFTNEATNMTITSSNQFVP